LAARARARAGGHRRLYSSAFLLEHEGRLADAAAAWRAIIAWNEACGFMLQATWPSQELERVRAALNAYRHR
jgi:hypothetical protein